MMSLSLQKLDSEISHNYQRFWNGKPESLRQLLSDSPTQQLEFLLTKFDLTQFVLRSKKRRDFQRLAILSWYFPEEVGILLRLQLQDAWKTDELNVEKEILLSSKEFCLAWIVSESGWSESTFFGNVLEKTQVGRLVNSLDFKRLSQRRVKKYTGYCRGYRESNRGAPRSFPPELSVGVIDYQEMLQKRLNRQLKLDQMMARIRNFLEKQKSA
jgi:hypothetical protein